MCMYTLSGIWLKMFSKHQNKPWETELLDQRIYFLTKFLAYILPYCTPEKSNHFSCPLIVYE